MSKDYIKVNDKIFLGRDDEQMRFRGYLDKILTNNNDEKWPIVFLLHGDGGYGKSTLAARFHDIANTEKSYAGKFQFFKIDWETESLNSGWTHIGRENISPEDVFNSIFNAATHQGIGNYFTPYQKALELRTKAKKNINKLFLHVDSQDTLAPLHGVAAEGLAKLVKLNVPIIGETGEKITRAFAEVGIKVGIDQAQKLWAAVQHRMSSRLAQEEYELIVNPHKYLARTLGACFKSLTERGMLRSAKPLIITFDTYEEIDRLDHLLRDLIISSGKNVLWILCSRNDLSIRREIGRESIPGYRDVWERRFVKIDVEAMARVYIRQYLEATLPEQTFNDEDIEAISRVTRGIPLAFHLATEMFVQHNSIKEIVGDTETPIPAKYIVREMTRRYLKYAINNEADRIALYALALARGDEDLLRAMLRPNDDAGFDLHQHLSELHSKYRSIWLDEKRLPDEPTLFLIEDLKSKRGDNWVIKLNQSAVETLYSRIAKLEVDLPCLEDRCDNEDWVQTVITLCYHLFWLDEDHAWRWLIPRLVEGIAYNSQLVRGLINIADEWKDQFKTVTSKKRIKLIKTGIESKGYEFSLLEKLESLSERGWLSGDNEQERLTILEWKRADTLFEKDRFDDTFTIIKRAHRKLSQECVGILPKLLADIFIKLGLKYILLNNKKRAKECFEHSINLNPSYSDPHSMLGMVHLEQGDYKQAISCFEHSISLDPEDPNPHNYLGNLYYLLNEFDKARQCLEHSIELDLTDYSPYNTLGNVYHDLKEFDKAKYCFERSIKLAPQNSIPHNNIGFLYYDLDEFDKAREHLEHSIVLDPKNAIIHNNLGNLYREIKEFDKATECYERAIVVAPKNALIHMNYGNLYCEMNQLNKARDRYEYAISLDPQSASIHNNLGNLYRKLKKPERAKVYYEQAIILDPKDASPHTSLGILYFQLNEYEKASIYFKRATDIDPEKASFHTSLAHCYIKLGMQTESEQHFQMARQHIHKESVYKQACFEAAIGNAESALNLLQAALENGDKDIAWMKTDPDFDRIRDDARFIELLERFSDDTDS